MNIFKVHSQNRGLNIAKTASVKVTRSPLVNSWSFWNTLFTEQYFSVSLNLQIKVRFSFLFNVAFKALLAIKRGNRWGCAAGQGMVFSLFRFLI